MHSKIYTPNHNETFLKTFSDVWKGFYEGRELAYRLFLRDFKSSYQASILGVVWIFLPPLATACVWIFLNKQNIISIKNVPMSYPAYTLCGTMFWSIFTEALTRPMQRYTSSMGLMVKLNFPREAIILTSIYDLILSLLLKMIVLFPLLWILGYPPSFNWILATPFILGLIFLGISFGVLLASFGILFNDISRFVNLGLPFLMYLTPVVYSIPNNSLVGKFQAINPVTPLLERIRSLIGSYEYSMYPHLLTWLVISVITFIIGTIAMRIALPIIIERSGS
jgi:lipopolysaccharide transport system permease protein